MMPLMCPPNRCDVPLKHCVDNKCDGPLLFSLEDVAFMISRREFQDLTPHTVQDNLFFYTFSPLMVDCQLLFVDE